MIKLRPSSLIVALKKDYWKKIKIIIKKEHSNKLKKNRFIAY
jgi:hypothetical protein